MAAQSNLYGYSIGPEERVTLLSYLPLAHIYEVCLANYRLRSLQS